MTSRTHYAVPIDCIRRVDSSIEQADIGANFSMPVSSETITAHIEGVESTFERRAVSFTDQTKTNELHEGIERDYGWTVYLDEANVEPLDTNAGDKVEIRSSEDTWTDVTDDTFLDPDDGIIEIDRRFVRLDPFYPHDTNYRFRVTYRHGADGEESGSTTLTSSIASGDSEPITADVNDASEIVTGAVVLVGGEEYFFVTDRNTTNDTLTLGPRAIRGTTASTHDIGDEVSFVPLNVRDAISAKVATRLLRQDDFLDALNEGAGDSIDTQQKIEDLDAEFEDVVSRYARTAGYV